MPRVKQEKKIPTASQRKELLRLERESDRLLDLLFDDPTNQELLDELNRIDVDYVRLSGEKSMEY
nr:MAG TPA: hypothetical protein [Caudoviricetes sp.]